WPPRPASRPTRIASAPPNARRPCSPGAAAGPRERASTRTSSKTSIGASSPTSSTGRWTSGAKDGL
ncbi:MAG: hypothetical protein AVDCRST_MAG03-1494, partial [uncultured Rubrobacteraceae bacterium]